MIMAPNGLWNVRDIVAKTTEPDLFFTLKHTGTADHLPFTDRPRLVVLIPEWSGPLWTSPVPPVQSVQFGGQLQDIWSRPSGSIVNQQVSNSKSEEDMRVRLEHAVDGDENGYISDISDTDDVISPNAMADVFKVNAEEEATDKEFVEML